MSYPKKSHCKNGHEFTEENTYHANGRRHCRTCRLQRVNNYTDRNRKTVNERKRTKRRESTKKERRVANLKHIGWTLDRFNTSLEEQKGLCAICEVVLTFEDKAGRTRANADHEHCIPPKPRGVLCGNCNLGIGNLQDSIELLKKAIAYLEKYA